MTSAVVDDVRPGPISASMPTEAEWARLGRRRTPVLELLGMVTEQVRSELGNARWTDGWCTGNGARFEWKGGPSVADVLEMLLPVEYDGEISGIPGLRLQETTAASAMLYWLPTSTSLYLTRLNESNPAADSDPGTCQR